MRRFRELAASPYFNKHRDVLALVKLLEKHYPDFSPARCSREQLSRELFAERPKPQQHLAVIFTYTLRLFYEFIALEEGRKQPEERQLLQLKFLRRRGLFKTYEKQQARLQKKLQEKTVRDSRYHQLAFALETEKNRYHNLLNTYESAAQIVKKQQQLDMFFLSEKLRDACELHIRNKITQHNYELPLGNTALAIVQKKEAPYQQIPSIAIYHRILNVLRKPDEKDFEQLLKELQKAENAFEREELQNIYNYLQNHCIEQINSGKTEYLRKAFELYKTLLEKNLLLDERGFLPEWHYKNITTIGLRLQEEGWIDEFLTSYREMLPPESRDAAFAFNRAAWHYACGNYEQVLRLLAQLEYHDFRYYLGAKSLLLRTYYELEEYEALSALAEAFRQYLKRHKILADERVKAFRRLLRFTRRALLIKINKKYTSPEKNRAELQKLKQQILQTEPVINREWLLQKLEEIHSSASGYRGQSPL